MRNNNAAMWQQRPPERCTHEHFAISTLPNILWIATRGKLKCKKVIVKDLINDFIMFTFTTYTKWTILEFGEDEVTRIS